MFMSVMASPFVMTVLLNRPLLERMVHDLFVSECDLNPYPPIRDPKQLIFEGLV